MSATIEYMIQLMEFQFLINSSVTKTVMIQGPPIEKHVSEPDVASGLPGHVRM